jgi:peptidoglycan/LPS O-acetylase OafA/YrhL
LTGVRAVAAWMVFVYHFRLLILPGDSVAARLLGQSFIGVNIFFVLSGFLIPWRYAASACFEQRWWISYLRNRIGRIYPLAMLTTVIALIGARDRNVIHWVSCLFLTKAFSPSMIYAGVSQAWTLTVEECFYFSVPLIIIWGRGRSQVKWLAGITAALWAVGFFLYGPQWFPIQFTIFGRCAEFFAGMLLAALLSRAPRAPIRRIPWMTLAGLFGTLAVMLILASAGSGVIGNTIWLVTNNFLAPAVIAIGLYGLIVEKSVITALLGSRLMVFCGRASFAFYLIHVSVFEARFDSLGYNLAERFLLLMALSGLLYLGFEEPMRKLIRGKEQRASATRQAA